ncbi:hypothetical protein ABPH35_03850 [Streptococcus sp. ZJ93]|uniref:hypothetical protein n=1 Tax=Streptococcus handemini TaxID=3161188 RepID=UPI0032EE5C88
MKKLFYLGLLLLTFLGLSACSVRIGEKMDTGHTELIRVYDADGKKILETKDQEILNRFGEYVGSAGENVEGLEILKEMPAEAKIAYHFVLTTKAGQDVDLYIYENDNHIVLKNLPLIGNIKLPLSEKELDWLHHPENW